MQIFRFVLLTFSHARRNSSMSAAMVESHPLEATKIPQSDAIIVESIARQ
jgi:hypothetical protein